MSFVRPLGTSSTNTDVSSQEALVKGYADQSNAVQFVNDYRADGGKGTADLKKAVQYASTSQMTRYADNLYAYAEVQNCLWGHYDILVANFHNL